MDDTKLPLTQHLAELRSRIFKVLIACVIGTALAWSFTEEIFGFLLDPAVAAAVYSSPRVATGGVFEGDTVTVTVPVSLAVPGLPSLIVYAAGTSPVKVAFGVNV